MVTPSYLELQEDLLPVTGAWIAELLHLMELILAYPRKGKLIFCVDSGLSVPPDPGARVIFLQFFTQCRLIQESSFFRWGSHRLKNH